MELVGYQLIDSQEKLEASVAHLAQQKHVFIDLEFDKNHYTYGFSLCLMQIASEDQCFLIDPLADLSIQTIFPVLENSAIQKVCYAFGEDLRLLHHIGCMPKNMLDLSTARSLLNLPHVSLNSLIEEITGTTLPKSQQKSNWCFRPLTEDQLKYAAVDVIYLPQLHAQIVADLKQANRWEWMEDEIAYLDGVNYSESYHFITVKESDKKHYTKQAWMRYIALLELREELAKEIDRPGYKIMDKRLVELLARKPQLIEKWPQYNLPIHRKVNNVQTKERIADKLAALAAEFIQQNISAEDPAREPLSPAERERLGAQRAAFSKQKNDYFLPLKEKIKAHYGENLANYLLSSRLMTRYFYGEITPLPYQEKLFSELKKL